MISHWLIAQLAVTAALTGLCWTVQLAIYAQFSHLLSSGGVERFSAYHASYVRSIGLVAGPLMVTEAGLAAWGCWTAPSPGAWLGAATLVLIWTLTFGFIVQLHNRLQTAPDAASIRRLNRLNAVRTALWATRLGLVFGLVLDA